MCRLTLLWCSGVVWEMMENCLVMLTNQKTFPASTLWSGRSLNWMGSSSAIHPPRSMEISRAISADKCNKQTEQTERLLGRSYRCCEQSVELRMNLPAWAVTLWTINRAVPRELGFPTRNQKAYLSIRGFSVSSSVKTCVWQSSRLILAVFVNE